MAPARYMTIEMRPATMEPHPIIRLAGHRWATVPSTKVPAIPATALTVISPA